MCELSQAKPKIARILPSPNFKASPLSPGLLVVMAVAARGRAAWGSPSPTLPQPGNSNTCLVLGWGRQGSKRPSR